MLTFTAWGPSEELLLLGSHICLRVIWLCDLWYQSVIPGWSWSIRDKDSKMLDLKRERNRVAEHQGRGGGEWKTFEEYAFPLRGKVRVEFLFNKKRHRNTDRERCRQTWGAHEMRKDEEHSGLHYNFVRKRSHESLFCSGSLPLFLLAPNLPFFSQITFVCLDSG